MSTSSTIYNLMDKTAFYLDHAYWLNAPTEALLSFTDMTSCVNFSRKELPEGEDSRAGRGCLWLDDLHRWLKADGAYIVITDDGQWGFDPKLFNDYKKVNN